VRVARRAVAAVVPPEEPEEPAAPEELGPAEAAASPEAGNLEPNEEIRS
jgi:hypothetical protein